MGLIACPDCQTEVSDQAPNCINCGRPLSHDLVDKPAAGSADAMKAGRQRSKLRNDLGNVVGLIGFGGAWIVALLTGSITVGVVLSIAAIALWLWITYGS